MFHNIEHSVSVNHEKGNMVIRKYVIRKYGYLFFPVPIYAFTGV
jgi:hypothetical protein